MKGTLRINPPLIDESVSVSSGATVTCCRHNMVVAYDDLTPPQKLAAILNEDEDSEFDCILD